LVIPKDVSSPVNSTSNILKLEGQGSKFQPNERPDLQQLGKSTVLSAPQAQPVGRPQFNTIKDIDESPTAYNKNFPPKMPPCPSVPDFGSVWNSNPANPPKDFLNNVRRDFGNNYDSYAPPGRDFDKIGRGGGSVRRGGRDCGPGPPG